MMSLTEQMDGHAERMYALVTARITALGDLAVKLQDARLKAVQADTAQARLDELLEGERQLDRLRHDLDAEESDAQAKKAAVRRHAALMRPLENGYGYAVQFPKQIWDSFQAVLQQLPADERKSVRAINLTKGEYSADNFVPAMEGPLFDGDAPVPLGVALASMMEPPMVFPKQESPLHSVFLDDVFPRIEKALAAVEQAADERLKSLFDQRMAVVKDVLEEADRK